MRIVWKCKKCGKEYNEEDIYIDEFTGEAQDCPHCLGKMILVKKNENNNK